ncbi:MAG: AAA family ATPase [Candidatus Wallbacteria bacterium]|nr:AAA family ATPase [Candidatus Wallbacteria bacterium]
MIKKISIKNFKCFDSFEAEGFSRINLIGGMNNVGKTALLEALMIFQDEIFAWKKIQTMYDVKGLTYPAPAPELLWFPLYHNFRIDESIKIKADLNLLVIEYIQNDNPEMYTPPVNQLVNNLITAGSSETAGSYFGGKNGINEKLHFNLLKGNDTFHWCYTINQNPNNHWAVTDTYYPLMNSSVKAPESVYITSASRINEAVVSNWFGEIDKSKKADKVVEYLKLIEPRIASLNSIHSGGLPVVHCDIGLSEKLPLALLGSGTMRLLEILLGIIMCKDKVVFVDEIENGFHHSVQSKIWESIARACQDYNVQLFATTHSYELLSKSILGAKNAGMADEFRYIRLEKINDRIEPIVFDHELLKGSLESNFEVR